MFKDTLICVETPHDPEKMVIHYLQSEGATEMFCRPLCRDVTLINCRISMARRRKIKRELSKVENTLIYFLA